MSSNREHTKERIQKVQALARKRQRGLVVVLVDVHDPHNAAAVLRTCEGLGIQEVHYVFDQVKPYDPKAVGKYSSSTANKWITTHVYTDGVAKAFEDLKQKGYVLAGTTLSESACALSEYNFTQEKIALVFGNEHKGLPQEVVDLCDDHIMFPMRGMIQSFNISVMAAITMYEAIRQRDNSPEEFLLDVNEQQALIDTLLG